MTKTGINTNSKISTWWNRRKTRRGLLENRTIKLQLVVEGKDQNKKNKSHKMNNHNNYLQIRKVHHSNNNPIINNHNYKTILREVKDQKRNTRNIKSKSTKSTSINIESKRSNRLTKRANPRQNHKRKMLMKIKEMKIKN